MSTRHTVPLTADAPPGMERVCAFTLVTALAWLGHDCPGSCPTLAGTMRATIWFTRRTARHAADVTSTLVVVDLNTGSADPKSVRQMLRQVNACVRQDHIRVRERAGVDRRRALDRR